MPKGRPRQFDVDEALDKAMLVFWRKGYRGTSLDDLTEAMEINRPSLYSAFKDKEMLFLQSIDRYRTRYLVAPTKKLLSSSNLRSGLIDFFSDIERIFLNEKNPPGCMIACLLTEDCCDSPVVKEKLEECINLADSTFRDIFEKHRSQLVSGLKPKAAARMLTTTLHGLAIRARAGAGKKELMLVSATFIDLIISGRK
ncbi:MAG: TetR/AcrR family transcriptional regulator [Cyanobacteria bacterium]|nr:TetR/AcrR family transcriptional regulator [Cyanobacteriota bacterium]